MKYRRLGNTGLNVSSLSLGAMTFTAGYTDSQHGAVYKVDKKHAVEMVGYALDKGVNFFDTADVYAGGESELILGEALGGCRDQVVIATKVGHRSGPAPVQAGLSRRHILWSVEQSLRRLGTDWIDIYVAHWDDPNTPLDEVLTAMDSLVRSGKVRYLAFSNWPAWRAAASLEIQRAAGLAPFTHGQMYYSLIGRDIEHDVIPMLQQYGLGLTVWSPLAFGFLSGKYSRDNLTDSANRYAGADLLPFDKEQGFEVVDRIRDIATRHNVSVAQVALAWLLANPVVTSVIIGASRMSQLKDNLAAVDTQLSPEDLAELKAVMPPALSYPQWVNDRNRGETEPEALTS